MRLSWWHFVVWVGLGSRVWQESSPAPHILGHTDKVSWKNIFSGVWISVLCDSCEHSQSFCVTWLELLFAMLFCSHWARRRSTKGHNGTGRWQLCPRATLALTTKWVRGYSQANVFLSNHLGDEVRLCHWKYVWVWNGWNWLCWKRMKKSLLEVPIIWQDFAKIFPNSDSIWSLNFQIRVKSRGRWKRNSVLGDNWLFPANNRFMLTYFSLIGFLNASQLLLGIISVLALQT